MEGYVSRVEYISICGAGAVIPIDEVDKVNQELHDAECDINTLTYNRIIASGLSALTTFQQDLVKRAVCYHANFRYEYGKLLSNPLSSYSLNGVSMSFDSSRLVTLSGVTTLGSIYSLLRQTGLTFRGVD